MWHIFRAISIAILVYCCGSMVVNAAEKCNQSDAIGAEERTDLIKTAADLYKFFKRYSGCDDGAIAEGIDESIARLLADRWDRLSTLNRLTTSDKQFEEFVLKHLRNGTGNLEDYRKIHALALQRCAVHSKELCKLIANTTLASAPASNSIKPVTTP